MQYRELGSTGIRVGEIGMGCEGFIDKSEEEVKAFIDLMEQEGANCIDLYSPNPVMRAALGHALQGRREKFVLQGHLGAVWKDGQYKKTRNIEEVKEGFEDQLNRLKTDHLEIGMVHYVDSMEDWHIVKNGPVMKYAMELKEKGTIQPKIRIMGTQYH